MKSCQEEKHRTDTKWPFPSRSGGSSSLSTATRAWSMYKCGLLTMKLVRDEKHFSDFTFYYKDG